MFIKKSSTAGWIIFWGVILTFVLLYCEGHLYQNSIMGMCAIALSLISTFMVLVRWAYLKDWENDSSFKKAFGIDIDDIYESPFVDEDHQDIQLLVNSVLHQKALDFHIARKAQEAHFVGVDINNPQAAETSQELRKTVNAAKRAFWDASDIAKEYNFDVKERYTQWLEEHEVFESKSLTTPS